MIGQLDLILNVFHCSTSLFELILHHKILDPNEYVLCILKLIAEFEMDQLEHLEKKNIQHKL